MVRAFEMPKTSPEIVAHGILDGVALELDEITPDPISKELLAKWRRDPKEAERALGAMTVG